MLLGCAIFDNHCCVQTVYDETEDMMSSEVDHEGEEGAECEGTGEEVRYDADGIPILPGYSNGHGMTQAIQQLPMGISVSKRTIIEAEDRAEVAATAVKMSDLDLANDSGISRLRVL